MEYREFVLTTSQSYVAKIMKRMLAECRFYYSTNYYIITYGI